MGDDHIRGFLDEHIDGGNDERAWNLREYGCVDDSQILSAAYAKAAVENCSFVGIGADSIGAGGVVAPSFILYKFRELLGRIVLWAGQQLLFDQRAEAAIH